MPRNRGLIAAVLLLFAASVGIQAARDRDRRPFEPPGGMLWVRSGAAMKRMAVGFETIVADLYWIRAVVYYGGQRLRDESARRYDLLHPMLDLVTALDPRFKAAYRFGAIFLTEAYPDGPGRPDQAIALLESGLARDGERWEYMHDIGFIYYWWLQDYAKAAAWFERGAKAPGGPPWLAPLAATTLAVGGDRQSSRTMWRQLYEHADSDWIRSSAERRLLQLDVMDAIDELNTAAARYASREGRAARTWQELIKGERLRGIPLDPTGTPFVIDPETGRVGLAPDSPLWPLPEEPRALGQEPAQRPPS